MTSAIYDDRKCQLGEGPFWHPERDELFWFDILDRRLLSTSSECSLSHAASAAGWVDENRLLMATEIGLELFDMRDGSSELVVAVEADNTLTRSNDGRTDPWGGFWFSTMGWNAQTQAASIYRYANGDLRQLHVGLTIPNAICFSPCSEWVYFADTKVQRLFRQALDAATGWPSEDAELFFDFSVSGKNPDGATTDAEGNLWIAMWGSSELLGLSPEGDEVGCVALPTPHVTCPASSPNGIYVTSALLGLPEDACRNENPAGKTFTVKDAFRGLPSVPVELKRQNTELTL